MTEIDINCNNEIKTIFDLPVVSVIVATYRRESVLAKALLSLENQTYESIQIVVVDDNADNVWNQKVNDIICGINESLEKKIVYIKNETNQGSAETRNIGIRSAIGDYVCFLDDDDIYLPNKIRNQIEHMVKVGSDYCITDLNLYHEDEKFIETRSREYIKESNKNALLKYHLKYHMTGTDTMMFKKEYLLRIGGFPPFDFGDEFYLMKEAITAEGIFSYLPICDIKAYVHTKTDGMSSGEGKIKGENGLFEYKKKFFNDLEKKDIQYIKMRHYAVLAFAELRRKNLFGFMKYSFKSFFSSPINCMNLFLEGK
jgi:glycosyltransferase involved in cell wall biosynthesis